MRIYAFVLAQTKPLVASGNRYLVDGDNRNATRAPYTTIRTCRAWEYILYSIRWQDGDIRYLMLCQRSRLRITLVNTVVSWAQSTCIRTLATLSEDYQQDGGGRTASGAPGAIRFVGKKCAWTRCRWDCETGDLRTGTVCFWWTARYAIDTRGKFRLSMRMNAVLHSYNLQLWDQSEKESSPLLVRLWTLCSVAGEMMFREDWSAGK